MSCGQGQRPKTLSDDAVLHTAVVTVSVHTRSRLGCPWCAPLPSVMGTYRVQAAPGSSPRPLSMSYSVAARRPAPGACAAWPRPGVRSARRVRTQIESCLTDVDPSRPQ